MYSAYRVQSRDGPAVFMYRTAAELYSEDERPLGCMLVMQILLWRGPSMEAPRASTSRTVLKGLLGEVEGGGLKESGRGWVSPYSALEAFV